LDIAEGSTPSEKENETEERVGADTVEAPGPTAREGERELWMHLDRP
jgi:hypothetical protein